MQNAVRDMDRYRFHNNHLNVAIASKPPPPGSGPRDAKVGMPGRGPSPPRPSSRSVPENTPERDTRRVLM
eukprot:scaffold220717_cov41-Prasinocladus_malaysianus.AAC.1